MWSDALKAFFPKGKDDPNLVLLEVRVRTAEYWEGPSSLIGKLLTFMVARATGNEEVMGENRILDMTGARKTSRLPPSSEQAKRAGRKAPSKSGPPAVKAARRPTKKVATKPVKKSVVKSVKKAKATPAKKAAAKPAKKTTARKKTASRK